jgi:hypothetical protein
MKATRVGLSLCLILCFLLVASISALGQKVAIDWDRNANFYQYRTYAWAQCMTPGESELWDDRIVQNIEYQLAAKGLRKAQPGQQPDVIINFSSDIEERVSYVGYDYGYGPGWSGVNPGFGFGPGWGWGGGGGPVTVEPIIQREFTLTIDMVDACQNHLLWRGVATDVVSHKSDKNIRRLRKSVEKLFRNYPYGED